MMHLAWNLAFFCALCSAGFGSAAAGGNFISENMRKDMEKLAEHFNVRDKNLHGGAIFLQLLGNQGTKSEEGQQRLLLHEALVAYVDILSSMMNRTEDSDVLMSIISVRERVCDLRRNYFQGTEHLKKHLQDLWSVQTHSADVQRKAVREIVPVLEKISKLIKKIQGRKEKRQRKSQMN